MNVEMCIFYVICSCEHVEHLIIFLSIVIKVEGTQEK